MYLLFDIGGTKTRIAYSVDGNSFEEPIIFDTPSAYEAGIQEFKRVADEVINGREVKAVAGGIAGPVSEEKGLLLKSPNLPDWINKPLKSDLEKTFNAPVYVGNDSAMVGFGEAVFGAGRGFGIVVYMTISTGVGGIRIVDGKIDAKAIGFEPGHQIIDADKTLVPAGGMTLEDLVSGTAVGRIAGKPPKEINDEEFWNKVAERLAYGINNTIVYWSPHVIVLGGSMITGNPAIPLEKAEEHLKSFFNIFPELPLIRKSELGNFGGLWGALAYLKQQ